MRPGVRIACDVGSVRIGIARSDALGMLAVPLDAVAAGSGACKAWISKTLPSLEISAVSVPGVRVMVPARMVMACAWGRSIGTAIKADLI